MNRTRYRFALAAAAAMLFVTSAGCGSILAIGAGVVLASGKGSSSSGGVATPVVTSASPAAGTHGGGTTITITGANFPGNATVTIGGVAATNVLVQSDSTITATTPRSSVVGARDVVVTNPQGGTGTLANGFTFQNALPVATVSSLSSPQEGNVVFSFTLADPESDLVDVNVEVDPGTGFVSVPPVQLVSGGLTGLTTSPTGTKQTLTFDSTASFAQQNVSSVRFRVTPIDRTDGGVGTPGTSNAFAIVNNSPPLVQLIQPANDAYDVVISYRIANPDPTDTVQVTALRWNDLSGNRSGAITLSPRAARNQGLGAAPFSAGGTIVQTVWDALVDLGFGNNKLVTVSVTVSDGKNGSVTATSAPFFVSNGPVSDQVLLPIVGLNDGFALGDVTNDARPDLVAGRAATANNPAAAGTVSLLVNRGRNFDTAKSFDLGTVNPIPNPSAPASAFAAGTNPFLNNAPHPTLCAMLDVDGDRLADLAVANAYHAPATDQAFLSFRTTILANGGIVDADRAEGFAHVSSKHAVLLAPQRNGEPDLSTTNGRWEPSQALVTDRATRFVLTGQAATSNFQPSAPGTGLANDRIGWFIQDLVAADLDPPAAIGAVGSADLVILHAHAQLGPVLATPVAGAVAAGASGVVVIRQFDPTKNALGQAFYLDPHDMGTIPTQVAIADLLSSTRTALGFPAPQGSRDILVANTGDSSLTLYELVVASATPGQTPPTYASVRVDLKTLGLPAGDTAGIAIGDLNGDRANDFVVIGQRSKKAIVFVWTATPTSPAFPFRNAGLLDLPELNCGRPAIADVTGDGKADILVPSRLTNETLVFTNRGNLPSPAPANTPSFALTRFNADLQPFAIACADLNGDGRLDVVAPNHLSLDFSVYYQVTPGTLDERFVPVAAGQSPAFVDAGDLDGDGIPEVVCANNGSNDVYVYRRDPTAGLAILATYSTALSGVSLPFEVRVKDVDGDGRNDVLVSMQIAVQPAGFVTGGWEVIRGNPLAASVAVIRTGTFRSAGLGIDAGDLNGDGIPDVVLTSPQGSECTIFSGVTALSNYVTDPRTVAGTRQARIVDVDGDGQRDIVVTFSNAVGIFYGSSGTFPSSPTIYSTLGVVDPVGCTVADFDGNGLIDVGLGGFVNGDGGVLYQTSPRVFTVVPLVVLAPPTGVNSGDLNGDGLPDFVMCWPSANLVAVYLANPNRTGPKDALQPPITFATASAPYAPVIVDVDGDGKRDLVVSARGANSLNVFFQR